MVVLFFVKTNDVLQLLLDFVGYVLFSGCEKIMK